MVADWLGKKMAFISSAHFTIKWALLFLALVIVICNSLYLRFHLQRQFHLLLTALIIGVIVVFAVEWIISSPKTPFEAIKSISISIFCNNRNCFKIYHRNGCFYEETFEESVK